MARNKCRRNPSCVTHPQHMTDHAAGNMIFRILKWALEFLPLLAVDVQLPHPGAKRAGVEPEEFRRAIFPFDSASGFLEHHLDVVVFQLVYGFDVLPGRLLALPGGIKAVQHL